MKLLKRFFISNFIVVIAFVLMPVFLITDDISIMQLLIDLVGKPE